MNYYYYCALVHILITVAARPGAWAVFTLLSTGIVGLGPAQGMDICVHLFCVYVLLYCPCRGSPNEMYSK